MPPVEAALPTAAAAGSDGPTCLTPTSVKNECKDDGCAGASETGSHGGGDGAATVDKVDRAFSVSAVGRRCWYKFVPAGASQPLKRAPSTGANGSKLQYECRYCSYVSDR